MNLKLEAFLHLPPQDWTPEKIAELSIAFSDLVVELGYGNVAAESFEDTKLSSALIVAPSEPDAWKDAAGNEHAMAVTFPTADKEFVKQAQAGGIIE